MKDFEKIDWKQYNKPPYLQQWLCRDDTLKLATFGDSGLAEVDDQVLALKDQWDLDRVSGHFLERIGKILNEKRNGNTDEYYRVMLKLRRLLNTNDGSIPSIIKAIKFIYTSEIVHIVPDYPAGLIIEHDGEGTPGLNFNKLLNEIIPAGVSFSTKEIFNFIEELLSTESQLVQVKYRPKEEFEGRIYHNRRVLHNGKTILSTELKKAFHNGVNYYDRGAKHNSQYTAEGTSYIRLPLTRESGYRDPLIFTQGLAMRDFQFSQLFHNGSIRYRVRAKYDGGFLHDGTTNRMPTARHNRRSLYSISDSFSVFDFRHRIIETFPVNENPAVNVTLYDTDQFRKPYDHNGKIRHNAAIYHSGWALDFLAFLQNLFIQDKAAGKIYHNNILRHEGREAHSGLGNTFAYEQQSFKMESSVAEELQTAENQSLQFENNTEEPVSKFYKHNRGYTHNKVIRHTSLMADTLTMRTGLAPVEDIAEGTLRHRNSIKHDGSENHSLTGTKPFYDASGMSVQTAYSEPVEMNEAQTLEYSQENTDIFTHNYRFNRGIKHNGIAYHFSPINDKVSMSISLEPVADEAAIDESFIIGFKYHHFHNGVYFRNNGIKHNAGVLVPLEEIA